MELKENYKKGLDGHAKIIEAKHLLNKTDEIQKEFEETVKQMMGKIETEFIALAKFIENIDCSFFKITLGTDLNGLKLENPMQLNMQKESHVNFYIVDDCQYRAVILYDMFKRVAIWKVNASDIVKDKGLINFLANWDKILNYIEEELIKKISEDYYRTSCCIEQMKRQINSNDMHHEKDAQRYTLIVSEERDGLPLSYYAEYPWRGTIRDYLYGNSVEDFMKADIEGLFYQLFDHKTGIRISYGSVDYDRIREEMAEYEAEIKQVTTSEENGTKAAQHRVWARIGRLYLLSDKEYKELTEAVRNNDESKAKKILLNAESRDEGDSYLPPDCEENPNEIDDFDF